MLLYMQEGNLALLLKNERYHSNISIRHTKKVELGNSFVKFLIIK